MHMTSWRWAALLLATPVAAAAQSNAEAVPVPTPATTAAMRAGDIVRLRIWREPDLSGDFPVDERGEVVLPKLGPMIVTAISGDSLQRRLTTMYGEYLRNPSIDVTLLRRITISGAVRNPGLYPVDATMTVADAVAIAGGAASDGRVDRVLLQRDGRTLVTELRANTSLASTPLRSGDQLYVPQKRWLSRNAGVVAAIVSGATAIAVTAFFR